MFVCIYVSGSDYARQVVADGAEWSVQAVGPPLLLFLAAKSVLFVRHVSMEHLSSHVPCASASWLIARGSSADGLLHF